MLKSLQQAVGIDTNDKNMQLLEVPKNKEVGSDKTMLSNAVAQCDLTVWPSDDGFQYLLAIVDVVGRSIDGEPLRSRTSTAIRNGFEKIFSRNHIKPTFKILQCDPGAEFKNAVIRDYFNSKNISVRYGRTGRSNQQAIIEYYNGVFGKVLNTKMTLAELRTNKRNIKWRASVPALMDKLNEDFKKEEKSFAMFLKPVKKMGKAPLLKIGTKVHVKLEEPRNAITNQKFHGGFRQGELRFSKEVKTITNIHMLPNSFPRYIVSGETSTSFSREELRLA